MQYSNIDDDSVRMVLSPDGISDTSAVFLQQPDMETQMKLYARSQIPKSERAQQLVARSLMNGLWETNPLQMIVVSPENIQIVQNAVRAGVYEKSNHRYICMPPSPQELKKILHTFFWEHVETPMYLDDREWMRDQIRRLDEIVTEAVVKALVAELDAHVQYCKDQSTLPVQTMMPKRVDRDDKPIELTFYQMGL